MSASARAILFTAQAMVARLASGLLLESLKEQGNALRFKNLKPGQPQLDIAAGSICRHDASSAFLHAPSTSAVPVLPVPDIKTCICMVPRLECGGHGLPFLARSPQSAVSVVQSLCRECSNEQDEGAFCGRSRKSSLPAFLTVLIQPMAIAACQAVHAPALPVGDRACAEV